MREIGFLSDENKTVSIIGNDQIEGIQIVVSEEISTWLKVSDIAFTIVLKDILLRQIWKIKIFGKNKLIIEESDRVGRYYIFFENWI